MGVASCRKQPGPALIQRYTGFAAGEGEQLNVVFTHVDPREYGRKFQFAVEVQQDSSYAGGRKTPSSRAAAVGMWVCHAGMQSGGGLENLWICTIHGRRILLP
jgi:hypothetical protein